MTCFKTPWPDRTESALRYLKLFARCTGNAIALSGFAIYMTHASHKAKMLSPVSGKTSLPCGTHIWNPIPILLKKCKMSVLGHVLAKSGNHEDRCQFLLCTNLNGKVMKHLFKIGILLAMLLSFTPNGAFAQKLTQTELLELMNNQVQKLTKDVSLVDSTFSVSAEDDFGITISGKAHIFNIKNVGLQITGGADKAALSASFESGITESMTIQGKPISSWIPSWLKGKMDLKKLTVAFAKGSPSQSSLSLELSPNAAGTSLSYMGLAVSKPSLVITLSSNGDNNVASAGITSIIALGTLELQLGGATDTNGKWSFSAATGKLSIQSLVDGVTSFLQTPSPAIPTEFSALDIEKGSLYFDNESKFSLSGDFAIGGFEAFINKKRKQFVFAVAASSTYRFASLSPVLAMIDSLKMEDMTCVISNISSNVHFPLNSLKKLGIADDIIPAGLSLMGKFTLPSDLPGMGASSIIFSTTIPKPIALPVLKGAMKFKNMSFGTGFELLESYLSLEPSAMKFAAGLRFKTSFEANKPKLTFNGSGYVAAPGTFGVVMFMEKGSFWKEPFGIKGLKIGELGLDIAADVLSPVPRPAVGIAGTMQFGPFRGAAVGAINSANPLESVIGIEMNGLGFQKICDSMMGPEVRTAFNTLPATARSLSLDNALLQIVPKTTTVAGRTLEQGLRIAGTGVISGFTARLNIGASYTNGFFAEGVVSPIVIKHENKTIFKLSGFKSDDSARMALNMTLSTLTANKPFIYVDGKATLMEAGVKAKIEVSKAGFYLSGSAKLFNAFEGHFDARGNATLSSSAGMSIRAAMKTDMFSVMNAEVIRLIDSSTKADQKAYKKAKADLKESRDYMASIQSDVEAFEREDKRVKKQIKEVRKIKADYDDINLKNEPWRAAEKGALWTAYEAANATLKGYRKALEVAEAAVDWGKKDAYAALITACTNTIDIYAAATYGTKYAARFIVENGLGGLVDVKSAEFAGALNAVSGGFVQMKSNLVYADNNYNLAYGFSFGSPLLAAKYMTDQLLSGKAPKGKTSTFESEIRDVE